MCEGDDDKYFFQALIETRGLPDFQICHTAEICGTGGKSGFSPSLAGMEVISGWDKLSGLLLVTDNDVVGTAFQDAQSAFVANGHTPPANPMAVGNMVGKPVAILMVPNAITAGDLELLALPAIHQKWPPAQQ